MTKLQRVFSYLITALTASVLTLAAAIYFLMPVSKLNQLEGVILSCFIGESDAAVMEDAAANAMVASLGDRWSYYIPASSVAQHAESAANAYVGIGITIVQNEEKQGFEITAIHPGGGAEAAGLQVGDIIVSAEQQDTADMGLNDLSAIVRGEEGTQVALEILRGEARMEFSVRRSFILAEIVTTQMLNDKIGLIRIANFNSRSASDTIAAIEQLREQGAEALIFDVRNNPGGYVEELVSLLDYLLPEGILFRSVDYAGREQIERSDAAFLDMPMAVICNQDSYSAAEFFPAAIAEYGAAAIIGTPTFGKGYFQYEFKLVDGSAVNLSAGKYFTPKGESLIGKGLQPDILVEVTEEEAHAIVLGSLAPEDDPQIQAAVNYLRNR